MLMYCVFHYWTRTENINKLYRQSPFKTDLFFCLLKENKILFKDKTTYIFFSSWRFVLNSDNCSKRITCLMKPTIHDFVVMATIFFRVYIFVNKITKQLRICTLLIFWYYVFINYHWYIVFTMHIFLDTSESWKLYFAVALLRRYRKKERMPHDVISAHKNDKNHSLM